jgi:hypothetical protein
MFKVFPATLQGQRDTRLTLTLSVIPNSNYVIMVIERVSNIFACFLYCNHQVHRDILISLYKYYVLVLHKKWITSLVFREINNLKYPT